VNLLLTISGTLEKNSKRFTNVLAFYRKKGQNGIIATSHPRTHQRICQYVAVRGRRPVSGRNALHEADTYVSASRTAIFPSLMHCRTAITVQQMLEQKRITE